MMRCVVCRCEEQFREVNERGCEGQDAGRRIRRRTLRDEVRGAEGRWRPRGHSSSLCETPSPTAPPGLMSSPLPNRSCENPSSPNTVLIAVLEVFEPFARNEKSVLETKELRHVGGSSQLHSQIGCSPAGRESSAGC